MFMEKVVVPHNESSSKLYLPKNWEGKNVLVVIKDV
jgi:putative transposon-encoded protein